MNAVLEKKDMIDGLAEALLYAGNKSQNLVLLNGDHTRALGSEKFSKTFGGRHFNLGLSAGNIVSMAAGFSVRGKIPFVNNFALYSANSWEQIRNDICIPNLNVKIIGSMTGLKPGPEGAGMQVMEDIAVMRALPNMKVLCPADFYETQAMIVALMKDFGPSYLRLCTGDVDSVYDSKHKFEFGRGDRLNEGSDLCLFACGSMVAKALRVADMFEETGVSVMVVNIASIKPIDVSLIVESAKKVKACVSMEEHNVIGGLGSAVAEVLSENHPIPLKRIGMEDCFGESGRPEELYKKYGLDVQSIFEKTRVFINSV